MSNEEKFANWILNEGYKPRSGTDWCIYRTYVSDIEVYTTKQLFMKYKYQSNYSDESCFDKAKNDAIKSIENELDKLKKI